MSYYKGTCIFILIFQSVVGKIEKSSLTFVIDDTGSMFDDIEQVKYGVNLVFDTVVNSKASQIENFIIVTFNDPGVRLRTVTNDRTVFKNTLEGIHVDGGDDCPEMSMAGIELALTESLPGSYLYVLTDASAKDEHLLERVKNLATKKLSQIVFLLTGRCSYDDNDPQYQAYYKIAEATNGQVFHMTKSNVGEILKYVAETISSRKTVVASNTFSPGYGHKMTIPVDADMKDVVIAGSGTDPKIDVTAPDGSKPHAEHIVDIPSVVAVKIKDTKSGNYTAEVGSKTKTSVLVTATTSIQFKHGFSVLEPSSIEDTAVKPLPDQKSHLSIQLISDADVILTAVEITDIKDNTIVEMPLNLIDAKNKFYDTNLFNPPNMLFKITVKGYDVKTKTSFKRTSPTPVEPQKPDLEKYENRAPAITLEGGSSINVEYNMPLKISCKVNGFPMPDVVWVDGDGSMLPSNYSTLEIPFDFISVLNIDKVSKNATYTCKAANANGEDSKTVNVRIPGFERPKIDKTEIEITNKKGEDTEVGCRIIKGIPTPKMVWYYLSRESQRFVELNETDEILRFTNVNEDSAGFYRCLAMNDAGRDHHIIELIVQYPPFIKEDLKYIISKDGEETTLRCRTEGVPKPRVEWLLNGHKVFNDRKHHIYRDNSLRFIGSKDSAGLFTCIASNPLGSTNMTITVDYFAPVSIEPPEQSTFEVTEGEHLELPCHAGGYPQPTLKWIFFSSADNKTFARKISRSDVSDKLYLRNIRSTQEGFYTCVASNAESTANISYHVKINAPPKIERGPSTTFTAVNGDIVMRLPCKANGTPKPTITWLKAGFNVASGSEWYNIEEDGTLVIKNIDEESAGDYECQASNILGDDRQKYYVVVKPFPDDTRPTKTITLEEGKSSKIDCDIPHTVLDSIRWYKDKRPIGIDASVILENVKLSDRGIYTCRVSNFASSLSESISIIVGYKPKFIAKTEPVINFNEGMPAFLDCEARGEPRPKVTWYDEDEEIESNDFVYELLMTFDEKGKYTCIVSNEFGSINRTFEITSKDCFLNVDEDFKKNQPLMIDEDTLKFPQFENINGNLEIPSNKGVLLYCPRGFTNFPKTKLTAVCERERYFLIDGYLYNYSDLTCQEEVQPTIRKTSRQCRSENTEEIQIGYELLGDFQEVFEVCINKDSDTPVYAKQEIHRSIADKELVQPMWQDDSLPLEFDEAYRCETQINVITSTLRKWFHGEDRCCFNKRQLVNTRDLTAGLPQKTALTYWNIIPHWSTCNAKNWNELENRVRNLAKSSFDNLLVWTGTSGQLTLKNAVGESENITLRDSRGQQLPVPQYVWKVIQNPYAKSSVAVIQVNSPDLTTSEGYHHMVCRDVCRDIEWLSGVNWRDPTNGYTFCCSLPDFEKAFGYTGHFGVGNQRLLKDLSGWSGSSF